MDIMNADYADTHFPCKLWDAGKNGLTLSVFEWNQSTRIVLYGQNDFSFGEALTRPIFGDADPIRLYGRAELESIMVERSMKIKNIFADFDGTPGSENHIQMIVVSEKSR